MIKSILIVGGGSAGWITANLLNSKLNSQEKKNVEITVLESPNIPKVGVGEATVPHIRQTLYDIGLDEWEFMRHTDATFKTMIRFEGWRKNSYYDHPFDRADPANTIAGVKAWLLKNQNATDSNEFSEAFSLLTHFANHNMAPKQYDMEHFKSPISYAYHFDAIKVSQYLSSIGVSRGINHLISTMINAELDQNGYIKSIRTNKDVTLTADLYIDCTGMASRLLSKTMSVGFYDYSQYLLCDSAVSMNVDYTKYKPQKLNPYTRAIAMSAGWKWDIVLQNRRGLGYVYSSAHQDANSAESELRKHEGNHASELPVNHIKFNSHRSNAFWTKNCVAIGLSGGFLEPLESSGLYFVECAAKFLTEYIPYSSGGYSALSKSFNKRMNRLYDEVVEYLNLHYCLTNRDDTDFWVDVQKSEHILSELRDKLALWKVKPVSQADFGSNNHLFPVTSYEYILYGMGFKPTNLPFTSKKPPNISHPVKLGLSKLPTHQELIDRIHNKNSIT